jgi:hypothetical protein
VRYAAAVRAGVYLVFAVALLVVGSGLLAAGPRLRMVDPGAPGGTAFGVWPLLVLLAVTPAVVAVMLVLTGQRAAALALVAAVAAVAAGRLVLDLWLAAAPWASVRPELWAPSGIGPARAGPGPWLLVAGQACVVVAGVFAVAESTRSRGEHGLGPDPSGSRVSPIVLPVAVGCAVLTGFGLLIAPFRSADPRLLPRTVLDVAPPEAAGGFVLAAGLALAAALAATSPDHRVAVAGLVGTALAGLGVALPRLVVSALAPGLGIAPGPVVAVAGALGLAVLARTVSTHGWPEPEPPPVSRLSRSAVATGLRRSAGLLCLISGGCAIVAAFADPLRLADDLRQPRLPTVGLLLCTGGVLAAAGWITAMFPVGRRIRPALAVVAMAMPMAAAEYLTAVLGVLDVPGLDAGPGWWLACAAVLTALAGSAVAVVAGGFERDDVDLEELTGRPFGGPAAPASAAAAVLAVPAFLLPLADGAGRGVTGVFPDPSGLPAWSLLAGMAVVVGLALLGPRCRPGPAAVLYTGGCVLLMLRLARIPFGPRPLPAAGLAQGAWASVLCLVLLLVAATVAVRSGQPDPPAPRRPAPFPVITPTFRTRRPPPGRSARPGAGGSALPGAGGSALPGAGGSALPGPDGSGWRGTAAAPGRAGDGEGQHTPA